MGMTEHQPGAKHIRNKSLSALIMKRMVSSAPTGLIILYASLILSDSPMFSEDWYRAYWHSVGTVELLSPLLTVL